MNLYQYTHLGRIFDLRIRTHRMIVVIGIVSGALALVLDGGLIGGVKAGAAAGLAWALARELHPDNNPAALVAGVIAGVFEATVGGVGLGACYLLIVFLRIIVRTLGAAPKTSDLVLHLLVVVFVADTVPGFVASLGVTLALVLSTMLPKPAPRSHRLWAIAFAGAAFAGLVLGPPAEAPSANGAGWVLFGIAMVASIGLFPTTRPDSVGDIDREPLDGSRLRLGRVETVALLAIVAVVTGGAGVPPVAPALAAVAATGLFGVRELVSS